MLSHETHGVVYETFPLAVRRLSGSEDRVNVLVPRALLEQRPVTEGMELEVEGEVRSFNNKSGKGSRLVITLYAKEPVSYTHLHTADVRLAVKRILDSKTFDNGTICASEQSIVVERRMEGAVTAELKAQGAYLLDDEEHRLLSKFILRPNGTMNPAIVGKSVETVAKLAGLTRVPPCLLYTSTKNN